MQETTPTKRFYILGQGNYAVSMLLDNLYACFPEQSISVEIIANILAEENDSLAYSYATPGIHCIEKDHREWKPEPNIPCLVGSVGKSRRAIFEFFDFASDLLF
jgi:hypothetical protein